MVYMGFCEAAQATFLYVLTSYLHAFNTTWDAARSYSKAVE